MKNFLKSTLYLAVFALAGILFQISCSNADDQNLSPSSTPVGKLVYYKRVAGVPIENSIFTCNYDGTGEALVDITLPAGNYISINLEDMNLRMSPDGQKVFFIGVNSATQYRTLYSCDASGANVTAVIELSEDGNITLGGAY